MGFLDAAQPAIGAYHRVARDALNLKYAWHRCAMVVVEFLVAEHFVPSGPIIRIQWRPSSTLSSKWIAEHDEQLRFAGGLLNGRHCLVNQRRLFSTDASQRAFGKTATRTAALPRSKSRRRSDRGSPRSPAQGIWTTPTLSRLGGTLVSAARARAQAERNRRQQTVSWIPRYYFVTVRRFARLRM